MSSPCNWSHGRRPAKMSWLDRKVAIVGRAVPPEWALDFALPITFLGMVAPMLRSLRRTPINIHAC